MDLTKYAMPWQLRKMIQWLEKEHQHSGQRRNTNTFLIWLAMSEVTQNF